MLIAPMRCTIFIATVGAELKKGNGVLLIVSKGKDVKPVTVPSFLGMEADTASQKAEGLGLVVGQYQLAYSDKPAGQVIDQSIEVNSTVNEGETIVFTVSQGKESQPEIVKKTVTFTVPPKYAGMDDVSVVYKQDGTKVGETTMNVSSSDASVSYTFEGEKGTYSTVAAEFNGETGSSQVITF